MVYARDFELSPRRGLYLFGNFYHPVGIKVKAYHGIIRFGVFGFLLDGYSVAALVEFHYAVSLRVRYVVAEYGSFLLVFGGADRLAEHGGETLPVKEVVAQDQAYAVVADKFASDQKSLCQTFRGRLYGVFQLQTQRVPVSQQTAECSLVFRCGDDQNFPDAAEHQYRQGVVDHRFVENGQQLFADPFGDGVQAGAAASGQDDSFHGKNFSVKLMFYPGICKAAFSGSCFPRRSKNVSFVCQS